MPPSFEKMIEDNRARVRRIAQRYAAPGGADDLFQEILLQLWCSFKSFRDEAKIETWVYRIAFNTAMTDMRTRLRKGHDKRAFISDEVLEEPVPAERCHAEILTQFLNQLNKIDASVLMMYLDDIDARDIADILGISVNAVGIRINRMKNKFSDMYID